ncbi:Gldg family protein [Leptospira idonii]|uniref:Uncharacterized protein n=1 Tax=Leptospira idonii TaxID=1193500 RepID=A0A4R9M3X0_9LEPT|nr:Gldg family protein [Leptospira idonii]TGN19478.1 hypothetical protein EHS15_09095 [Leptospira idonii]
MLVSLDRIFPFLSVISLFLFFLLDGMVTDPAKRMAWLFIVFVFLVSDFLYRLIVHRIRKEDQNRYLGTALGVLAFVFSLLRDYLDSASVAGVNSQASSIPKIREFLLLLTVVFSLAFLLQIVLIEIGKSSLEAQSNLSKAKSSLLQNAVLGFLFVLPLIVAFNYFAIKRNYNFDLSSKGKFSLSPISRNLLKQIKKETTITAFYPRPLEADGPANGDKSSSLALTRVRPDIEILLDQIKAENPLLTVTFINADVETDLLKDFGQASNGTILVRSKKASLLDSLTPFAEEKVFAKDPADLEDLERKLMAAIFNVSTEQKKIYFTSSNGERFGLGFKSLPNEQVNRFTTNLQFLNFNISEWGFAQGWPSGFPKDADLVVILGPTIPFSEEAREEIKNYVLKQNGKIFITVEPKGKEDFSWLLGISGLKYKNEVLVERSEKPGFILARKFSENKLTDLLPKKDLGVLFPYSGYLVTESSGTAPFQFKSENLLETGFEIFADGNGNSKMDGDEKKENLLLSVLLTPVSLTGEKTGKIILHSGTSWITDQFIVYAMNGHFANAAVTGLFQDTGIAEIPPKKDEIQTISLSDNQKLIVWAIGVFLYPGLILGLGSYYVHSRRKKSSVEV